MAGIHRPRRLAPTRRRALVELALGTSAFGGLFGCGEQAKAQAGAASTPPIDDPTLDIEALRAEHAMERVAVTTYERARDQVGADVREVLDLFRGHHEAHVADIAESLAALDAEPRPPTTPEPLVLDDELAVLRYALLLETQAALAYRAAIAQLQSKGHVVRAVDILGSEIGHVVVLRSALADHLPAGFVRGEDLTFLRTLRPGPSGS